MSNLNHVNGLKTDFLLPALDIADKRRCALIDGHLKGLRLDTDTLERIQDVFRTEMSLGISELPSSLQMENTYIPELPDGTEEGLYLALDLGGTNFRVILLELTGGTIIREEVKHYHISDEKRLGCGIKLFDYLAECVADFVAEQGLSGTRLPMGFTFSFPMKQHSLASGSLVTWTKSFNCPSVTGNDVVKMLNESLKRCGQSNIDVVALLNDTTGTLLQGASLDHRTAVGMILGTGSNACYVERADRVKHWETQRHGEKNVVIDIEWGAFGDNGTLDFIKTPFDVEVDNNSLLTKSFTFEKYIGGKYLGEVVRTVLEYLIANELFLLRAPSERLITPWTFGTDYVSQIEQDTVDGTTVQTEDVLSRLGLTNVNHYDKDDVKVLQYVAGVVSNRAAQLVSVCVASLLDLMDRDDVTVAVDGSVYKHHPRLKGWIETYTARLTNKKFQLLLAEDGSGKGAALVAAIALKLKARNEQSDSNHID